MTHPAVSIQALLGLALAAPPPPPVHYVVGAVSTGQFESHPAFDPRTGDFYFVRSSPGFQGWKILRRRCFRSDAPRTEPFPFAGPGVEADPFFTPDGKRLYFISSRPDPPAKTGKDLDIWYVERSRDGAWGAPVRLPEPVNSSAQEWFPRLARDGTLTFGSGRPGGFGKTDIYSARLVHGRWDVRNLGGAVSTPDDDYEFEPSRDGRFAILMSGGSLYRIERRGRSWGERRPLLPAAQGFHVGPLLSPSGRTLLFAHDDEADGSGELYRLDLSGRREAWPLACPQPRNLR
jgi:hypothetical protein